jgi:hypothetical protein
MSCRYVRVDRVPGLVVPSRGQDYYVFENGAISNGEQHWAPPIIEKQRLTAQLAYTTAALGIAEAEFKASFQNAVRAAGQYINGRIHIPDTSIIPHLEKLRDNVLALREVKADYEDALRDREAERREQAAQEEERVRKQRAQEAVEEIARVQI